jgi:hypothetical protein
MYMLVLVYVLVHVRACACVRACVRDRACACTCLCMYVLVHVRVEGCITGGGTCVLTCVRRQGGAGAWLPDGLLFGSDMSQI